MCAMESSIHLRLLIIESSFSGISVKFRSVHSVTQKHGMRWIFQLFCKLKWSIEKSENIKEKKNIKSCYFA